MLISMTKKTVYENKPQCSVHAQIMPAMSPCLNTLLQRKQQPKLLAQANIHTTFRKISTVTMH